MTHQFQLPQFLPASELKAIKGNEKELQGSLDTIPLGKEAYLGPKHPKTLEPDHECCSYCEMGGVT